MREFFQPFSLRTFIRLSLFCILKIRYCLIDEYGNFNFINGFCLHQIQDKLLFDYY